jgi:hypothetical protein
MRSVVLAALVCVMPFGCASKPKAPPPEDGVTALAAPVGATTPAGNPVIVHIVSRNKTVTISSGPDGLLYSMKDADGKFAIAEATASEFEKLEPDLYRNIRNYVAVEADDAPLPAASIDGPIPTARHDAE